MNTEPRMDINKHELAKMIISENSCLFVVKKCEDKA